MVDIKLRGKTVKVPKVIEDRLPEMDRAYPHESPEAVVVRACGEAWSEANLYEQRANNPNIGVSAPISNEMLLAMGEKNELLDYMEKVNRGEIQF